MKQIALALMMVFHIQGALAEKMIVTDIAGRQVEVQVPVRHVILGEGRQLYIVAALDRENPGQRIMSWRNDLIEADPATYNAYVKKFPDMANIPTFSGTESSVVDLEKAIEQKPDVVFLNIESLHANTDAAYTETLAKLNIPVVYVDFRNKPMENTDPTILLFGKLFGHEERAHKLIAFRKRALERVQKVIAEKKPSRPKVFIERAGGFYDDCCHSFGSENFGQFVDIAGGENIADPFIPGTFGQIHPEKVIAANPEQIVITSANWQAYAHEDHWIPVGPGGNEKESQRKLRWYLSRPAYSNSTALKNQDFRAIWHQFYNSPYQFIAIQQLAKWFHPELFHDLDANATFKEFYEKFLPIDYEPGYWSSLNATK